VNITSCNQKFFLRFGSRTTPLSGEQPGNVDPTRTIETHNCKSTALKIRPRPGHSCLSHSARCFGRGTLPVVLVIILLASAAASADRQPRLIVQITADQLRGDLLRRYESVLRRGFRRLETGYWIRRGDVDFGLTLSFPGHAALATGMYPSHHGLTGNEWWVNRDGKWVEVDVTDDENTTLLNAVPKRDGGSPKYLLATTIAEWVWAADPRARAVALGTGNRIPIAYGGHKTSNTFWYDSRLNAFTTSSYYAAALPAWITEFNAKELSKFQPRIWESSVPKQDERLAVLEPRSFHDHENPRFPHDYEKESQAEKGGMPYGSWFGTTPFKDAALLALAMKAVDSEHLGQRGSTDYLAIDIDSTDNVGHAYGPRSLEQLDTLMRLDTYLEEFLRHLDAVVGMGNYVVAFSADHGVSDVSEFADGHKVSMIEIESLLDKVETLAAANASAPDALMSDQVATLLKSAPFVADAYTKERLRQDSDDPFVRLYARVSRPEFTTNFPLWTDKPRNYHPARYGVIVRFKSGKLLDAAIGVHGLPYAPDRDVPVIFYGAGVRSGRRMTGARTIDVAPTLAKLGHIRPADSMDGHVLEFLIADSSPREHPAERKR